MYNRPAGWIDRENASTNAIWKPGSYLLHGTEGWGLYGVDKNGYVNNDLPLAKDFYLVVGASHTEAQHVSNGNRYSDILNQKFSNGKNELYVYNCSQSSYYFPKIVKNFYAITQEFADAETIIIEIGSTDFSEKPLAAALEQSGYDESQLGQNILFMLSFQQKVRLEIKAMLPIYTIFKNQIEAYLDKDVDGSGDEFTIDRSPQYTYLNEALKLIRDEWDKDIIMYHPSVVICKDGSISIVHEETTEKFSNLCSQNHITFVDMPEAFEIQYKIDYSVPYGFFNSSMGKGHLNSVGHRIIAQELYNILSEEIRQ